MFQWRQLKEFFSTPVLATEPTTGPSARNQHKPNVYIDSLKVTCATSNSKDSIIFGDDKGVVHVISAANYKPTSFQAYIRSVEYVKQLRHANYLVTLGDDGSDHSAAYLMKIWNMEKRDSQNEPPMVGTALRLFASHYQSTSSSAVDGGIDEDEITCFEVNDDATLAAVGWSNGKVALIRGDIIRGKHRTDYINTNDKTPVTGVGFKKLGGQSASGSSGGSGYCLFIAKENSVYRSTILSRTPDDKAHELDQQGAARNCSCMSDDGDFILGTEKAVWFYDTDSKGSCFAFESSKTLVSWFKSYLVVASKDDTRGGSDDYRPDVLNIYDLRNKFIAHTWNVPMGEITHIVPMGVTTLFIVVRDVKGTKLFRMDELDLQSKLNALFKKNLYNIAIKLVSSQDVQYAMDIFRKYGDHLYGKGDYDGAVQQYINLLSIPELVSNHREAVSREPSYVIRKFLDAQRIHNLTAYLEALHDRGHADQDHTTLLLNCYTKLKDKRDKLDHFIRSHAADCDVNTAISVCRQAGYYEHALALAEKRAHHEWYLKIQIEDFAGSGSGNANYKKALRHIESLDFTAAERFLQEYGKILVAHIPKRTTSVLVRLCTSYVQRPKPVQSAAATATATAPASASQGKSTAASAAASAAPPATSGSFNTGSSFGSSTSSSLLKNLPGVGSGGGGGEEVKSLVSRFFGGAKDDDSKTARPAATAAAAAATTSSQHALDDDEDAQDDQQQQQHQASPEDFIHCFSDSPYWLIVFLERVIAHLKSQRVKMAPVIYNTLLELYLQPTANIPTSPEKEDTGASSGPSSTSTSSSNLAAALALDSDLGDESEYSIDAIDSDQKAPLDKAFDLLKDPDATYDREHALVLVQSHNFKEGILFLYEKLGLCYDIIQYYMEQGDRQMVIRAAKLYGDRDPNMWIQVLSFFVNQKDDCEEEIIEVLRTIDRDNLVPPLLVVQLLCDSAKTKLSTIKDYLTRRLQQEHELTQQDNDQIKMLQADTRKMREEVHELRTSARIFQLTTCSLCSSPLDLPAVHFLCMHSYHQRCLMKPNECPKCYKKNQEVLQLKESLEGSVEDHGQFFRLLEDSSDGFATVAEYFGRGIFKPTLIESDEDFDAEEEEDAIDY